MRKKTIITFTILFSILLSLYSKNTDAFADVKPTLITLDSFPFNTKQVYKGYRLHLSRFEVIKQKGNWIKIKCNITNTGKEPVKLGKGRVSPSLIFKFDPSLDHAGLANYHEEIILTLRRTDMSLNPGQLIMGHEFKLLYRSEKPIEATPPLVKSNPTAKDDKNINDDILSDIPVLQSSGSSSKKKKEKKTTVASTNTKKRKEKALKEKPKKEKKSREEKVVIETAKIEESPVYSAESSLSNTRPEIKIEPEPIIEKPKVVSSQEMAPTPKESINTPPINTTNTSIEKEEEAYCADLVIDSIKLIKQTKNWVTVEYTITNYGRKAATLIGPKRGEKDNLAIKGFLSRTQKVNRGAIVMGGGFIPDNFNDGNTELEPGKSFTGTIKLDYKKRTRFTPYIILDLDPFQFLSECNERNNQNSFLTE